jgi:hypothetical protein
VPESEALDLAGGEFFGKLGGPDGFSTTAEGLWLPDPVVARDREKEEVLEARAAYVISEIESSISYVNVEFIVCTALLVTNVKALLAAPFAGVALLVAFVAFLFGGLFFAVAGGEVARGPRGLVAAGVALEWGNVLTEWLGLYMLLFVLPVVVQVRTDNDLAGLIATVAVAGGYAIYVISGYDLMGRFVRGRRRIAAHVMFGVLTVAHSCGIAFQLSWLSTASGLLFLATASAFAVLHRRRGEFI